MMGKLQSRIDRELRFQRDLMKLRGALDMTLAQVSSHCQTWSRRQRADGLVCPESGRGESVTLRHKLQRTHVDV